VRPRVPHDGRGLYTHREVAAVVATQCVGIDLYVTRGNACRPCGKGQDSAAPHGGAPGRDHATVDGQPDPDRVAPAPFDRNCDRAALTGDRRETAADLDARSEEHTSELQSRENLVCRLL